MPPRVPPPMMATLARSLPAGDAWTYEVKFDGYRTLALKAGERVQLLSRNLKDVTAQYPVVARGIADLRAPNALLDGELVAVDENGRPSFQALHHQTAKGVVYYVFDLLNLDGRDLTREPLETRRERLAALLRGPAEKVARRAAAAVLLSEPLPGTPAQIERAVRGLGLEGVVAKRRGSRYEPGRRSDAWIKVKFSRRQEFVIGGFKPADPGFDSVLVGYYDGRKLRYAGKVRAGFTPHTRAEVYELIAPLETRRCPFVNLPNAKSSHWGEGITEEDMNALRWVRPRIVVEVSFTEWTRDGNLRHSSFAGVRADKAPQEVRREG